MEPQRYTKPENIRCLAARLCDLGYWPVPIPEGQKGPVLKGWEKLKMAAFEVPDFFAENHQLIGILHTNVLAIDIDVYDADLSAQIVSEAFRRFPAALERIGEAPKSALFFRMDEPGFKLKGTPRFEMNGLSAQVDIRSVSRQIVVYGKHPVTKKMYTWPRGELWETPRENLPVAVQVEIEQFRDWTIDLMRQWAGIRNPKIIDLGLWSGRAFDTGDRPTPEQFTDYLRHIPSNLAYDEWLNVLMGVHDFFDGSYQGLDAAKAWSSDYPDYTPQEVESKWRSFEVGRGISYKTVLHMAKQNGADLRQPVPEMKIETRPAAAGAEEPEAKPDTGERTDDPVLFAPWVEIDLQGIPAPQFVYSDFYARGYTSVTLAAPKVGKSMLGLAEAMDMATGRGFLTGYQRAPQRVVYFNAEDDQDVINSRISALLTHYGIPQSEIAGRLFPTSGVDMDGFFLVHGQDGIINEPLFAMIERFCKLESIDVIVFDPLQDLSLSPETNEVFRILGQRLRRMASVTNVALGLIHHTRKVAPGVVATIDDGRGGSALRGTSRFNRILIGMTEDEAAKAGITNHRHFFRIGDMESNLAPPSSDINRWFEKVSVPTPNGHHVGAVVPWIWPDAFVGITPQHAARVRNEIDLMAAPPRFNAQSKEWVGELVGTVTGIDPAELDGRNRIKSIVAGWIKSDILRVAEGHDPRAGRTVQVVVCGANHPLAGP